MEPDPPLNGEFMRESSPLFEWEVDSMRKLRARDAGGRAFETTESCDSDSPGYTIGLTRFDGTSPGSRRRHRGATRTCRRRICGDVGAPWSGGDDRTSSARRELLRALEGKADRALLHASEALAVAN